MRPRLFLILFGVAAAIQLLASLMGWTLSDDVSKCFLIPALWGYYVVSGGRSTTFSIALFFCWLGDVFLIFEGKLFFLAGLSAFLTGHLLYVLAYRQHMYEDQSGALLVPQKIRFSLPIVLAGTGLFVVLLPALGGLTIPVLFYSLVITLMTMTALFRYGVTNSSSFWLVFGGAVLFMISDSVLAFNMFVSPVPLAGFWIMLTYITAQVLIVEGIKKHQ
jgi:uncharacterized membrane protein YhhN